MAQKLPLAELRRRKRERYLSIGIFSLILIFTVIEVQLFRLSAKLPFVNSIFFFGLMNLNIVLVMVLLFLLFRNGVKLVLDERRGKIGSRLKTRLVFCFTLFAIVPTILLFSISAFYIRNSFDKWFNLRVGETLQRSIDIVKNYYENTENSAAHFAQKIAEQISQKDLSISSVQLDLDKFRKEYGLDGVAFYSSPLSEPVTSYSAEKSHFIPPLSKDTLLTSFKEPSQCRILGLGTGELIRCSAYLGPPKGVVFTHYFIPLSLASQLSEINVTYQDLKSDNPLNYPIKSTYFAILTVVTLLILFTASWTGFYVARRLTGPIESLVRGTSAVAQGNLNYKITSTGSDELSKLVDSFNSMVGQLRVRTEESNHRRRYIEVLLESVEAGVVSIDENENISMINSAATKLLGVDANKAVGQSIWQLLPSEFHSDYKDLLSLVYQSPKPQKKEIEITNPGKEKLTLLVTLSVLRDEKKSPLGIVAVFSNVTEIKKIERLVAWREVATRIAHEIKNPLTPIQLSVQRLRRRYLDKINDDGTFDNSTQIVLSEVESIRNLVSEFSGFARMPEMKQKAENLNELATKTAHLYAVAHENVSFKFELLETLSSVCIDSNQIKRVLINLFDNSVAAMKGQGTITVKTKQNLEDGLISLHVIDTGSGIETKVHSQLFEPYFSTKLKGTGLGLAIVQKIMLDHGGNVQAISHGTKGSEFVLEFPHLMKTQLPSEQSLWS